MPQISEIQISFIKPQNGLIGFASFVLNNSLYLSGVGIHKKLTGEGYRLTYPTRKVGQQQNNIFNPINRTLGKEIEQAILAKLNDVMEKCNDRYRGIDDGLHSV